MIPFASRLGLFKAQLAVGLLVASAGVWSLNRTWVPVWSEALGRFPDRGEIREGKLTWNGNRQTRLAENRFLALTVDLDQSRAWTSASDFQVEFGETSATARSLLGSATIPYPRTATISLSRLDVESWWGAWKPAVLAGIGAAALLFHCGLWNLCALPFGFVILVLARLGNRPIHFQQAFILAGLAALPAALVFAGALILYGMGRLGFVQLLWLAGLQLPLTLFFVLGAPFTIRRTLPAAGARPASNPFTSSPS